MKKSYLGYFADFDEPTILISGNSEALKSFLQMISLLESGHREHLLFNNENFYVKDDISIEMELSNDKPGIQKLSNDKFHFSLLVDDLQLLIKNTESVISSNTPCHQYLDIDSVYSVVISKDEYPSTLFE